MVCNVSFVCVFFGLGAWIGLDNRPTRAGAALRASPLDSAGGRKEKTSPPRTPREVTAAQAPGICETSSLVLPLAERRLL